tara:strand:+ start:388 stop:531 length:144 start_codon:yes stop_codon:yes gene_type:complete
MALDKQKIQNIMLKIQNNDGYNLVKPSVVLRKPLESIPVTIAKTKKI